MRTFVIPLLITFVVSCSNTQSATKITQSKRPAVSQMQTQKESEPKEVKPHVFVTPIVKAPQPTKIEDEAADLVDEPPPHEDGYELPF